MQDYSFFKRHVSGLVRWLWQIEVVGAENQPQEDGYLLCSNHTSMSDVIVLAVGTKRIIHYMAKAELLHIPIIGSFLKSLGAFPVRRGKADLAALKHAMNMIEAGDIVGFFPQGTRCPHVDPRTTDVKSGAGMMVYHTKCKVVPVYIKTKQNKTKMFHKTQVIYGPPISYEELPFEKGTTAEFREATAFIFDRICALGEQTPPVS